MTDDTEPSSPVRQARNRSLEAKLRYDQGRHGIAESELTTLLRQWQTWLWHYYDHIAGYKQTPNIEELWHEPIAPDQGHPDTLAQLEPYQFATHTQRHRPLDPATGVRLKDDRDIPALWPADALRAIQAKLDECYHRLGFDEPPKRIIPESGHLGHTNPEWFDEEITDEVFREFIEALEEYEATGGGLAQAYKLVMDDAPEAERTEP